MKTNTIIAVWKDIQGYQGYQASCLGQIWEQKTKTILKQRPDRGFVRVGIRPTGQKKLDFIQVQKLVRLAFLDSPTREGMKITHLNGKKDDNRVENLILSTQL